MVGNKDKVAVTYAGFANDLRVGNRILVDDGLIGLDVIEITEREVICKVLNNGDLGENRASTCRASPSSCRPWPRKTSAT